MRGEITIVISGAVPVADAAAPEDLVAEVTAREAAGETRKEAIAAVALKHSRHPQAQTVFDVPW